MEKEIELKIRQESKWRLKGGWEREEINRKRDEVGIEINETEIERKKRDRDNRI
jgi:hypothetical protein